MRTLLSLLVVYAQLLNDALYPLVIRLQLGQYVFHRALDQSACYHPEALSVWVFVVDLPQCLEDQAAGGCEVGFRTEGDHNGEDPRVLVGVALQLGDLVDDCASWHERGAEQPDLDEETAHSLTALSVSGCTLESSLRAGACIVSGFLSMSYIRSMNSCKARLTGI